MCKIPGCHGEIIQPGVEAVPIVPGPPVDHPPGRGEETRQGLPTSLMSDTKETVTLTLSMDGESC